MSPRYAELQVTSHFSFLQGASSCEELFAQAANLGIEALAVVDCNSLAGIVRAHEAAKVTGVRIVVCRLDLIDGMSVLVYPTDRAAYSRLCRLLSVGKKRAGKAKCVLHLTGCNPAKPAGFCFRRENGPWTRPRSSDQRPTRHPS